MLFNGQIDTVQSDVKNDISVIQTAENQVIQSALTSLDKLLRGLIEGYTIEIKAVKNPK
jgi:hypothetical protein